MRARFPAAPLVQAAPPGDHEVVRTIHCAPDIHASIGLPEKLQHPEQFLQAMVETYDGFVLAERDLEQRGPGSFLGTRQSGFAELQMANLTNVHLIENARKQVQLLLEQNPELSGIEFAALHSALERFWSQTSKGDIS